MCILWEITGKLLQSVRSSNMAASLIIDLGGTKSRLGLCRRESRDAGFSAQAVYRNGDYKGIHEVIERFLDEHSVTVSSICVAVAGVVRAGKAEMTNLSWTVSEESLKKQFSLDRALVINDLTALAAAVPHLKETDTVQLQYGSEYSGGVMAIIAPGTGLGQGYVVPVGESHLARGSEGGHSGFSPGDEEELRLAGWLMKNGLGISAEDLCAGPSLTTLYRYYNEICPEESPPWLRSKISGTADLAPLVVEGAAAAEPCPLCIQVIDRYLALLGREAANLALKVYALGGVYIGGGVILHLLGKFSFSPFLKAFRGGGKMTELLESIPVLVISKDDANLYGALYYDQTSQELPSL